MPKRPSLNEHKKPFQSQMFEQHKHNFHFTLICQFKHDNFALALRCWINTRMGMPGSGSEATERPLSPGVESGRCPTTARRGGALRASSWLSTRLVFHLNAAGGGRKGGKQTERGGSSQTSPFPGGS